MTTFALQVGLFFRRKLLETLREPVWLITGLTTPLLYLALFEPLLRSLAGGRGFPAGHVLDVFVPGVMVLIAFGAGMVGHARLPASDGLGRVPTATRQLLADLLVTPLMPCDQQVWHI